MKISNRTFQSLNQFFESFIRYFNSTVQNITLNHGKEFNQCQELEQCYGIITYFAIHINFGNGGAVNTLIVDCVVFLRKLTLLKFTTNQVLEVVELINNRPLKLYNNHITIEIFRACSD